MILTASLFNLESELRSNVITCRAMQQPVVRNVLICFLWCWLSCSCATLPTSSAWCKRVCGSALILPRWTWCRHLCLRTLEFQTSFSNQYTCLLKVTQYHSAVQQRFKGSYQRVVLLAGAASAILYVVETPLSQPAEQAGRCSCKRNVAVKRCNCKRKVAAKER